MINKSVKVEFCVRVAANILKVASIRVFVNWDFPFLPRVGEFVEPTIWFPYLDFRNQKIEEKLTAEAKADLQEYLNVGGDDFESWFFDNACRSEHVVMVSYYTDFKDDDTKEVYASIVLDAIPETT